jgi:hypothetical protein
MCEPKLIHRRYSMEIKFNLSGWERGWGFVVEDGKLYVILYLDKAQQKFLVGHGEGKELKKLKRDVKRRIQRFGAIEALDEDVTT